MRSNVASDVLYAYPFARVCACRWGALILQAFTNLISKGFFKIFLSNLGY